MSVLKEKKHQNRQSYLMSHYCKMKCIARRHIQKKKWERALHTILIASGFMYTINQIQYDEELEELLSMIAFQNLPLLDFGNTSGRKVIYYDSLGNAQRGLTPIYLDALRRLGYQVEYITFARFQSTTAPLVSQLGQEHVFLVQGESYIEQMQSLAAILEHSAAGLAMLCMSPDDVVGVGVFSLCSNQIQRYMINMTDHTFWLGRGICDIVLNFREFGWKVCADKRNLPSDQLCYLPYYPKRAVEEFEGFPFQDPNQKYLFSGGALYKTESKDHKYYLLLEGILSECPELNFVYLGNGQTRKLRELARKFPGRVTFSAERKDFYEVLQRCTIYLSTYPYNGGLMTQFALHAGKIPISLSCKDIDQELTINHEETYWNFTSMEECIREIKRLLSDREYLHRQEADLGDFLINESQFTEELDYILTHQKSIRSVSSSSAYAFEGFRRIPMENFRGLNFARLFFRKKGFYMIRFFPLKYLLGGLAMMLEKRNNTMQNRRKN